MPGARRARPTIRCLNEDLGLELPGLDIDLEDLAHPFMDELRRVAPTSPDGQKRILSIDSPLVYRIRVSSERGATWVDEQTNVVWLCAAHRREDDSDDDAFVWFSKLHVSGRLLPDDDDRLRDAAEAVLRLFRDLEEDLHRAADRALGDKGTELRVDLGDYLPCRLLVVEDNGVEEIWCAISVRATDGAFPTERLRELLFASLGEYLSAGDFEARTDWPSGDVEWFEVVRLWMR